MKKTLIALALTTLSTAALADVVLYGEIKGGVEVSKHKGVKGTTTQIVDYGSKIGFKGQEELDSGLKAIWQVEQAVNIGGVGSTFGTRDSFVGLSGGFGTVKAGYQKTPVADLNDKLDVWNYSAREAGLATFTRGNDAVARKVALTYETPDLGGFKAKAYVSPSDNSSRAATGRDSATYGLSAGYENSGFFGDLAAVYVRNGANNANPNGKLDGYQGLAQVGYGNDRFLAGLAYQHARDVDGVLLGQDVARVNEVALTGTFNVTEALRLKGSAAAGFNVKNDAGVKAWEKGRYYQGIVGADYALSKRTLVNGQVGYLQAGDATYSRENNTRGGTASIGMSHKF